MFRVELVYLHQLCHVPGPTDWKGDQKGLYFCQAGLYDKQAMASILEGCFPEILVGNHNGFFCSGQIEIVSRQEKTCCYWVECCNITDKRTRDSLSRFSKNSSSLLTSWTEIFGPISVFSLSTWGIHGSLCMDQSLSFPLNSYQTSARPPWDLLHLLPGYFLVCWEWENSKICFNHPW